MPKIKINGTELYYEDTGGSAETIVFSHGLLWYTTLFANQITTLKSQYRYISYDHRGQGRSADDNRAAIDMDLLTADVVALIDALQLGRVHFCGLSMGGFVGMRLAARHPELVGSLILCETSADCEPQENAPKYARMNFVARWLSPRLVMSQVMPILFGNTALHDPARANQRLSWLNQLRQCRRSIWRAVNGVILREAVSNEIPNITAPTLVIVGDEDVATIPAKAERIASLIPGSRLVRIARAGHSSTVEEPVAVSAAISAFLNSL